MRKLGKIVLATLVGAMILACASCKRDDPSVSGATFELSEITGMEQTETDDMSISIKFNADGTCVMTAVVVKREQKMEGKWTQDGTSVTLVFDEGEQKMTVSSDGSILTCTMPMGDQSVTYTLTRK